MVDILREAHVTAPAGYVIGRNIVYSNELTSRMP